MSLQNKTTLVLVSTASALIGLGIGYRIAERRLTAEFEERIERETNAIRRMYKPGYDTPQDMAEKLYGEGIATIIDEVAGKEYLLDEIKTADPDLVVNIREPVAYDKIRVSTVPKSQENEEPVVSRRIFEENTDRGEIYVITIAEHTENDPGYEQATWTYYAGDGVLTDIHEDRIEDPCKYIGTEALTMFGEVSDDPNVVHVRNEVIMMDYEIVRSNGSYREEVLGEETPPERPSQRISRGS